MRSHTGATFTLGKRSVYSLSTKQKINTRSSTEAELVGMNDTMALILWTRHFLEGQGFTVTDNVVFQDNESAMLLENNGRLSSTKRTRHIEIRYFFVTDNIKHGRLQVMHCPTKLMVADFFTNPLQGAQFRLFRDQMCNCAITQRHRSVLERPREWMRITVCHLGPHRVPPHKWMVLMMSPIPVTLPKFTLGVSITHPSQEVQGVEYVPLSRIVYQL